MTYLVFAGGRPRGLDTFFDEMGYIPSELLSSLAIPVRVICLIVSERLSYL